MADVKISVNLENQPKHQKSIKPPDQTATSSTDLLDEIPFDQSQTQMTVHQQPVMSWDSHITGPASLRILKRRSKSCSSMFMHSILETSLIIDASTPTKVTQSPPPSPQNRSVITASMTKHHQQNQPMKTTHVMSQQRSAASKYLYQQKTFQCMILFQNN